MQNSFMTAAVFVCVVTTAACGGASSPPEAAATASGDSTDDRPVAVIDHVVESIDGESVDLGAFRGRPLLIVNTASKCGYTPQYAGLQKLHERFAGDGLVVIAFPSNDFGNQEPGSPAEIKTFCEDTYAVSFPLMAKVHTKGPDQAPVYRTLTEETADDIRGEVRWNFTKFLVDGDGHVVARYESGVDPLDDRIVGEIEKLLRASDG
jgi:glutathione peroxidase